MTKLFHQMPPHELGETGKRTAVPFLVVYLRSEKPNDRRLAASGLIKLHRNHNINISLAIPFLLENSVYPAPQVRQYSLNALSRVLTQLSKEEITQLKEDNQKEKKNYNITLRERIIKDWNLNQQRKELSSPKSEINLEEPSALGEDKNRIKTKPEYRNFSQSSERTNAEKILVDRFNILHFYDQQWETIARILSGERVLLVQKTGFGKSLCFQYPASQFAGLTIVFSPLIALMRDQIKALNKIGIPAACINSGQNAKENSQIIQKAIEGNLKLLYISPERQENQKWREAVQKMDISMVVIDEAHCISVWGHDFRPAYRRIINLVNILPQEFPVLAVTATATERTAEDIQKQIGQNTTLIRGNLMRENFHLRVVHVSDQDAKLAYLAIYIKKQKGTGLIYTGTRKQSEMVSNWLQTNGIDAVFYHAGLPNSRRQEIEEGLLSNRWKCIVSTNALGMGMNKSDIRFLFHTQIPQSPIHYYQEIGRAGRDEQRSDIVLLYHPQDNELPEYFIKNNRPSVKAYHRVIDALRKKSLYKYELTKAINLKKNDLRIIINDLLDQEILNEIPAKRGKKFELKFGAPKLDLKQYEVLRNRQMTELKEMVDYCTTPSCRMQYLCSYLGDQTCEDCKKCDVDLGKDLHYRIPEKWRAKVNQFHKHDFPILRITSRGSNLVNGIAASYYGVTDVGAIIHRCKYEKGGDYPEVLIKKSLEAYYFLFEDKEFDVILYVPPTISGNLVKNFAGNISSRLNIPISHKLKKAKSTQPQKVFQSMTLKRENVKGSFCYQDEGELGGKTVLLIDDIFDSGATIKEIGKYLTSLGVKLIAPLVIAKTAGGENA